MKPEAEVAPRKEIYLGDALKRLLKLRPDDTLTTVVNLIAERYDGLVSRMKGYAGCTIREEDVYRAVIRENRRHLESREIALFPKLVEDWLARNPEYPRSAYERLRSASYLELLVLVDKLERDQ